MFIKQATDKSGWAITLAAVALFSLWKIATLEFRFGDENVYFYMSEAILNGLLPHRDYFTAVPPLFPLLLAGWKLLIGEHLILFKLWPVLFDSLSAVLIYLILRARGASWAALGPVLYLFSFTVLSTSDYVTGGELAIFLMLLAIYLSYKGETLNANSKGLTFVASGVAWAAACLSKFYVAPALIGFLLYKLIKKNYHALGRVILGGIAFTALVMTPFLIMASHELYENLITHQLSRPPGLNKWTVLTFFLKMEWLLILSGLVGAFATRKKDMLLPFGLLALFFLWFQDLYYLYLHILIPFLVILAVEFVQSLKNKMPELAWAYIILYTVLSVTPLFSYINTFAPQGVYTNPEEIAEVLRSAPDDFPIFGAQEVAPLAALMSGRPMFENIADPNTQTFASGAHDRDAISERAAQRGVYLVARIADYPELGVENFGFDRYFNPAVFESYCTLYRSFDRPTTLDELNKIKIFRCYKSNL